MTFVLVIVVIALLSGIILLSAKSPLKEITREEFLQELTKFLEGTMEVLYDNEENGKSFRITFDFKGENFIYEDLEGQGFKDKVYKAVLKIKTPSKLTLTFTEKERTTKILSDIFMASEISAHYVEKNTYLQVPEPLRDMKVYTNDTSEANRLLEDKKIVSILRKYKNTDMRGYQFLSLGIVEGTVILEFRSGKTDKPSVLSLRENIPSIDDYLEQLIVLVRKLREKK